MALTAMAHGGEALGRADDGRVVLVGGGLPGEEVTVRVTDRQPRYSRGVIAELPAAPSPHRIRPACPLFGTWPERGAMPSWHCGGCQWQHIEHSAQLAYKADLLRDALRRQGHIDKPPVEDPVGPTDAWHYRNHVRLRAGPAGQGYRALDGVSILPTTQCPAAHPLVGEMLAALELQSPAGFDVGLRAGAATGDQLIVLTGEDATLRELQLETSIDASVTLVHPGGRVEVAAGRPYLLERLRGREFEVPPTAFFQAHTAMAEIVVDRVAECLPQRMPALFDVYAGVGVFAALFADRAERVYSIEADEAACAAAARNASGLDNVTIIEGDAGEALTWLARRGEAEAVAVVDPPRGGVGKGALGLLRDLVADTIVYVSCNAVTLARDARALSPAGWRMKACWPIDMFPQTHHIESVSLFRREES